MIVFSNLSNQLGIILQITTPQLEESVPVEGLTLLELILKGGFIMYPIAFLLLVVTYITIERALYLRDSTKRKADFIDQVKNHLKTADVKGAKLVAEHFPSATGRIIRYGLDGLGRPIREIESVLESATNIEVAQMEKNMSYLGIIAGIAPMLGFIGTISGIIHIFYDISLSDNISIGIIAGGLYEKMITSGAGLVVGVLAYSAYHLLHVRVHKFTLQIQKDVFEFMQTIQK
jgi:biopolymer transport protein ExbB